MAIGSEAIWKLCDVLGIGERNQRSTTLKATVTNVELDGTIWVTPNGSSQSTPIAQSSVSVETGDTVSVTISGGRAVITGSTSNMAIGERQLRAINDAVAKFRKAVGDVTIATSAAMQAAREAADVANATNQHFWTDDNGVHVTSDEEAEWSEEYAKPDHGELSTPSAQRPWHNTLTNSLGILLRTGLINLVGITRSAIAFYDGNGNDGGNITASFGINGAQIGKSDSEHVVIDENGFTAYDSNGELAEVFGILDGNNLKNETVGTTKIVNASITEAKIGNAAITTAKIHDLAVTNAKIADAAITDAKIEDASITTAKIEDAAITSAKINDAAITSAKIDDAAITTAKIHAAAITTAHINQGAITTALIATGAVGDAQIADVSANKLTAGTIDASDITVTNLNAANITTGTLNGQRIGAGSLSLDKLEDDVYTQDEIDAMLSQMQTEIDGAIETWTGSTVPTLNNYPASSWTTSQDKHTHIGDVYYVVNSASEADGYSYRFAYDNTTQTYSWNLIRDSVITDVLQRLIDAEGDISGLQTFETNVNQWKTVKDGEITTLQQSTSQISTALGDKVSTSTFNTLSQTVDGNSSNITQLTNTTNSISNQVSEINQTVDGITTRVSDFERVQGEHSDRLESAETAISQTADSLELMATKTELGQEVAKAGATVYDHTFVEDNGVYTFTAYVYHGSTDISETVHPSLYVWFLRTEDGDEEYATGRTITVSADTAGFRGSIVGGIDDTLSGVLVDCDGDALVDDQGNGFEVYAEWEY